MIASVATFALFMGGAVFVARGDGSVITEIEKSDVPVKKVAYLTFDDGPSSITEGILDTLSEKNVKATFFVCAGESNDKYMPLLERTEADGHQIAIHSASHDYKKIYSSPEAFWSDIDELKTKIAPYVKQEINCMRFPGGSTNTVSRKYGGSEIMKTLKAQATEKGYRYFDWNNCPGDALGQSISPDTLVSRINKEIKGQEQSVILLHDIPSTATSARALPTIIDSLTEQGYTFDVLNNHPESAGEKEARKLAEKQAEEEKSE